MGKGGILATGRDGMGKHGGEPGSVKKEGGVGQIPTATAPSQARPRECGKGKKRKTGLSTSIPDKGGCRMQPCGGESRLMDGLIAAEGIKTFGEKHHRA